MTELLKTPLFALHEELGAKMVPFAGYEMPVQFPMGVMKEHLHTRKSAGVFDVSHMGQIILSGPNWEAVALGLERLIPQAVVELKDGRQRYGFFTNEGGGIEDDLMFARRGESLYVVVNAVCKQRDLDLLRTGLPAEITVTELTDQALIALQGPKAGAVVEELDPRAKDMRFMDVAELNLSGHSVWASRSGYTGEDGFEISVAADQAEALTRRLIGDLEALPIGLGARDSLRLEAGLCLYGQDINTDTTPVSADLVWAIQKARRPGGDRAGGFPGATAIFSELAEGVARKRVGLKPEGRAPMRSGTQLFADETSVQEIGQVTSGGFGPSLQMPVAMGYVGASLAQSGTQLWGDVRGKRLPVAVVDLPFVPLRFKR